MWATDGAPVTEFESVGVDIKWQGQILTVGVERFRRRDDGEVSREKVWHPGAVAMLAVDERFVWLTRQPREAVGEGSSLEVPAGKLDVEGEAPADGAARELSEEIGKRAARWEELMSFYTSPGIQRRADLPVPGHRPVRRPRWSPRGGRADRRRPVAPRPARRRDRRMPRREVADRAALAEEPPGPLASSAVDGPPRGLRSSLPERGMGSLPHCPAALPAPPLVTMS